MFTPQCFVISVINIVASLLICVQAHGWSGTRMRKHLSNITLIGVAGTTSQTTSSSIVLSKPGGVVVNNVLYAMIWIFTGYSSNSDKVNTLSGWTLCGSTSFTDPSSAIFKAYLFRRVATGAESSSFTFTYSNSEQYSMGMVLAYAGQNTTTPEDVSPVFSYGTNTSDSVSTSSISTVSKYTRVISIFSPLNDSLNLTAPVNFRLETSIQDVANNQSLFWYDQTSAIVGATGPISSSGLGSSGKDFISVVFALRPK